MMQIFLKEVAEKIRPPRALWVPYAHGYPLGEPNNPELQIRVLKQTFALLDEPGPPPVLREYAKGMAEVGSR